MGKLINQSQILIVGGIISARLGVPNISKIFTDEIVLIIGKNPTLINIILISLLKIFFVITSFATLIQLAKNIDFTYNKWYIFRRRPDVFWDYIFGLVLATITTIVIFIFLGL